MKTKFFNPKSKALKALKEQHLKNNDYPDAIDRNNQTEASSVKNLVWGYLSNHKDLSLRKLASRVVKDLKKENVKLSLESVQRIFSKDAKKAPLALEQILLKYFFDEGFKSKKEISAFCKKNKLETQDEFSLVPTELVNQLVQLWLSHNLSDSKRTLSQILKTKLDAKGYNYNLGSIQNILSFKVNETKKVIVLVLEALLLEKHYKNAKELQAALKNLDPDLFESVELVDAEAAVALSEEFLAKNSEWTKRKLSLQLSHDLKNKNLHINHTSLQHILAGKRKVVKQIVIKQLQDYLQNPPRVEDCPEVVAKSSSRLPKRDLKKIHKLWQEAEDTENKERIGEAFYAARMQEMKRVWEKRQQKKQRKLYKKAKPLILPESIYY